MSTHMYSITQLSYGMSIACTLTSSSYGTAKSLFSGSAQIIFLGQLCKSFLVSKTKELLVYVRRLRKFSVLGIRTTISETVFSES